jgi:serine/threonine-protein kinase
MLLPEALGNLDAVARFLTEAETRRRLRHPNIARFDEQGEIEGRPFFVTEFLEGQTLAQKISGKPASIREAVELTQTLARAIHHGHQRGILHLGMSPESVMLTSDGNVKITDFGSVRMWRRTVSGRPGYMAPGESCVATDVYALGAMLYEMLTGRPPFSGQDWFTTLQQQMFHPPMPPSQLRPEVPPRMDAICLKCLQEEPSRRYTSAEELADELQRLLDANRNRPQRISLGKRMWEELRGLLFSSRESQPS